MREDMLKIDGFKSLSTEEAQKTDGGCYYGLWGLAGLGGLGSLSLLTGLLQSLLRS